MKLLIKNNLIMMSQSINSHALERRNNCRCMACEDNDTMKEYVLGEVEGHGNERRYICRMQVAEKQAREVTGHVFEQIVMEANNEYQEEQPRVINLDRKQVNNS